MTGGAFIGKAKQPQEPQVVPPVPPEPQSAFAAAEPSAVSFNKRSADAPPAFAPPARVSPSPKRKKVSVQGVHDRTGVAIQASFASGYTSAFSALKPAAGGHNKSGSGFSGFSTQNGFGPKAALLGTQFCDVHDQFRPPVSLFASASASSTLVARGCPPAAAIMTSTTSSSSQLNTNKAAAAQQLEGRPGKELEQQPPAQQPPPPDPASPPKKEKRRRGTSDVKSPASAAASSRRGGDEHQTPPGPPREHVGWKNMVYLAHRGAAEAIIADQDPTLDAALWTGSAAAVGPLGTGQHVYLRRYSDWTSHQRRGGLKPLLDDKSRVGAEGVVLKLEADLGFCTTAQRGEEVTPAKLRALECSSARVLAPAEGEDEAAGGGFLYCVCLPKVGKLAIRKIRYALTVEDEHDGVAVGSNSASASGAVEPSSSSIGIESMLGKKLAEPAQRRDAVAAEAVGGPSIAKRPLCGRGGAPYGGKGKHKGKIGPAPVRKNSTPRRKCVKKGGGKCTKKAGKAKGGVADPADICVGKFEAGVQQLFYLTSRASAEKIVNDQEIIVPDKCFRHGGPKHIYFHKEYPEAHLEEAGAAGEDKVVLSAQVNLGQCATVAGNKAVLARLSPQFLCENGCLSAYVQGEDVYCVCASGIYLSCKEKRKNKIWNLQYEPLPPPVDASNRGKVTLYHATDEASARKILQSQKFEPGKKGFLGGAIYFSKDPEEARKRQRVVAREQAVTLRARVNLGRCGQWKRDTAKVSTDGLQKYKCDSAKVVGLDVFCVCSTDRVRNITRLA